MKRIRTWVFPAAIVFSLLSAQACLDSSEQMSSFPVQTAANQESERLQSLIEQLCAESGVPGLSVAIAEAGKETLTAAAGFADRDRRIPVTTETMFFIGSVSKNLFAAVILRLVDQGRLQLEDFLSDFVEWPRGDEVTIRMLLNHTSGIPEYMTGELFRPSDDGGIPEFFRTASSPDDLFSTLSDRSPVFDPGSDQDYSNTNGLLVGEVIRQVTGKPLAEAFDQMLVQPLGMQRMYLYGVSTAGRERARGYSGAAHWGAEEGTLADCSSADEALPDAADGSVVASAGDLLRYHQALRNGKFLSDGSWTAMRTVDPGRHNGLAYLIGKGQFGRYEGNLGRSMGHVAANVYYADHETYVVMMSNRSDVPLPLERLLKQWFTPKG